MVGDTFVAVCDSQLAAAGALLSATGDYVDAELLFYDDSVTDDHFPGFVFLKKGVDTKSTPCRILIVAASYWRLDLEINNYARSTVLLSEPRCRFTNKLYYLDDSSLCSKKKKPPISILTTQHSSVWLLNGTASQKRQTALSTRI